MNIDLRVKQPPARKAPKFPSQSSGLHLPASHQQPLTLSGRCSIIVMLTHTYTPTQKQTVHMAPRNPCAHKKQHIMGMWEWTPQITQIMGKHMSHRDHLLGKRQVSLYANEQVIHVTTNRRHRHTVDPSCTSKRLSKVAMLCLSEDYLLHFMYSKQYLQS